MEDKKKASSPSASKKRKKMHTHTSPHPLSRFLRSPNTVADEATTPFPLHIWRRAGRDAVATALQFTGDGLRLRLLLAHPSASLSLSSPALPLVTIYQRRSFSASQIPEPNPPGIRSPLRADRRRILRPVQLPRSSKFWNMTFHVQQQCLQCPI